MKIEIPPPKKKRHWHSKENAPEREPIAYPKEPQPVPPFVILIREFGGWRVYDTPQYETEAKAIFCRQLQEKKTVELYERVDTTKLKATRTTWKKPKPVFDGPEADE